MSNIQKNLRRDVKVKKDAKIGIAISLYNKDITDTLYESCVSELVKRGIRIKDIKTMEVPGAFELPYACKKLADTKKFDAIIALGAIIKGETPHFDFIAFACAQGIMEIGLRSKLPVVFGVLTTNNLKQAKDRVKGGKKGDKGVESALTALQMINL